MKWIKQRLKGSRKDQQNQELFKKKRLKNRQTFSARLTKERLKSVKLEMKETLNWYHRNTKNLKRDCYEQSYTNKLDNLEEMDKFIEIYNLPRIST